MKTLICWLFGHRKGKRIPDTDVIECPRCKDTWTRPMPKPKAAA